MQDPPEEISFDDFLRVDLRVGTVVSAEPFPEARKPAYKIAVDFGPGRGVLRTSAQVTVLYQPEELVPPGGRPRERAAAADRSRSGPSFCW